MKRNIVIIIVMVLVSLASFTIGRYDIDFYGIYNRFPIVHSYKDMAECAWEGESIYMDILNNIYEIDGSYFENIIECDTNYIKLINHYKKWENPNVKWDWESMYNL